MNKELRGWLLFSLLACIWGSSFILMKRGMYTIDGVSIFSSNQVGALRMAIAGVVMLPFGIAALRKVNHWKQVVALLIVGCCGNFIPAFLFPYAETKLSSGLAGMLNSFTPFFTLIIGILVFQQEMRINQIIGLIIGFAGIFLLVGTNSSSIESVSYLHVGAIILATALYGLSLNTIKSKLSTFKSWEITALAFSFLSIPSLISIFITGTNITLLSNNYAPEGFVYIAILSIVGTCLALVIFNGIIALKSAVFASSVTYVIPIVAVLLGIIFNHETFELIQLLGMIVILSGVVLANRK